MVDIKYKYCFPIIVLLLLSLVSCKNDADEETVVRNKFYGVADGIPFDNTSIGLFKDRSDKFTMFGNVINGISVFSVINGRELKEYPSNQEELLDLAMDLDINGGLDSTTITVSILLLIEASLTALPPGESFTLLFSGENVYYANRGSITLSHYDGSINRLFGDLDIELVNLTDGPRYIQATFEDVFFTDCPSPGLCFL